MPNFDVPYTRTPPSVTARAVAAWRRINDRATSVVIIRNGTAQAAQTMRVETSNGGSEAAIAAGITGQQMAVVYGVMDHPNGSVPDTSLERDDRFLYEGAMYHVKSVVTHKGEIQGFAEVES